MSRYYIFVTVSCIIVTVSTSQYAETGEETDAMSGLRDLVESMVGLAGYDATTAANDADNVISIELQLAMGQSNFSVSS
jgi:hypothetical protein